MITIEQLRAWRDAKAAAEFAQGETRFLSFPERWLKDPHWFCVNGHVSGVFLKCEDGGDLCLACHQTVILGPLIGEAAFAKELLDISQNCGRV